MRAVRAAVLAILAGAAAAPPSAARGAPDGGEREILAALEEAAAAGAPGARRLGDPFRGALGQGGAAAFEVPLPEAGCYAFLGVGGAGVQDLTVSVSVDGVEVAADRLSGVRPRALWCSPEPVVAIVKIVMYGGAGPFALGVYAARDRSSGPEPAGGEETDFIANRLRMLHAQYGKGRRAATRVTRGNLAGGGERTVEVSLEAGRCYTAIAAAEPAVKELDLSLVDRAGAEVARGAGGGGSAVAETSPCPKTGGTYVVRLRAARGAGQFGVQLFSD